MRGEAIDEIVRSCCLSAQIKRDLNALDITNSILSFRHTFLSNFYPVDVLVKGVVFPSVEHAYQAVKLGFDSMPDLSEQDLLVVNELLLARGNDYKLDCLTDLFSSSVYSAGDVKVIGDYLSAQDYVIKNWDNLKIRVMADLLWQKFQNKNLQKMLLDTGDKYLIEGNTWNDVFWGVCDGQGQNVLGVAVMTIRKILKCGCL
jgi:predicted NAD-dependent protein-ADP-ribosyltransferase YbiA (DUF1768 family)